jgi:SAM-dependent methyltransferase
MTEAMDQTSQTYKEHFHKFIEGTRGLDAPNADIRKWIDAFLHHIAKGGLIIEMGSAFGRDADYMKSKGYKIVCTDIAEPALEKLNRKGYETHMYDVRDAVPEEWRRRFDGYFANAVLLHLTDTAFREALTNAYDMLKHGGVAAFSLKIGIGDEVTSRKMDAPRYFRYYYKPEVEAIIGELPFDIISLEYTADEQWSVAILRKR